MILQRQIRLLLLICRRTGFNHWGYCKSSTRVALFFTTRLTMPSGGCIKKSIVRKWVNEESFLAIFLSITNRSFRAPFFVSKGKAMDFFGKYKSPFGYYNNANQIDSYGMNHSGFTTRDELEYQFTRLHKEVK